ncbi:ribosome maturation factor RimM [Clostridia bacterium]|nr:ribosome maturation factor RimM [Clostridia bacterium]
MPKFLEVGKIVSTHGIKGEVRVECWCDGSEFLGRFGELLCGDTPYKVELARPHKSLAIVKLKGVDSVEAAQALRGKILKADVSDVKLPEGRYFVQDLIGMRVADDETGGEIGVLDDVLSRPAHDIYVVGEHMIPNVPEFVKSVDMDERVIKVKMIEGL